jgi:hypothetical protein
MSGALFKKYVGLELHGEELVKNQIEFCTCLVDENDGFPHSSNLENTFQSSVEIFSISFEVRTTNNE